MSFFLVLALCIHFVLGHPTGDTDNPPLYGPASFTLRNSSSTSLKCRVNCCKYLEDQSTSNQFGPIDGTDVPGSAERTLIQEGQGEQELPIRIGIVRASVAHNPTTRPVNIIFGTKGLGSECRGEPGPKGKQGLPGHDGVPGLPGAIGIPGQKGVQGDPGTPGVKGDMGHRGFDGITGLKGDGGIPGMPGQKGERGQRGFDGLTGLKGDRGLPGSTGIRGELGPQGVPGIPGLKGEKGMSGLPGTKGLPGVNGVKGEPGSLGFNGMNGLDGLPGIRGEPGIRGPTGAPGPKGDQGTPCKAAPDHQVGHILVKHSQSFVEPVCDHGSTKLWSGNSLIGLTVKGVPYTQDLGDASSCVQDYRILPVVSCMDGKDCQVGGEGDRSMWLMADDDSHMGHRYISKCVVCEVPAKVLTVHSHLSSIPECPKEWSGLWNGYSFLMHAGGGQSLSSSGSCLKHFRDSLLIMSLNADMEKVAHEEQYGVWMVAIHSQKAKDMSSRISRCQVCMRNK